MRDIEKILCSIVENEEMRLYLISQLEGMSQKCIKDLIMNARCSMEKKNEFLKLLAKNNDYYRGFADFTEEALKNFYSGLKEDVTVLGYNTGVHTKASLEVVGFESAIAAQKYIKENFDDRDDMWFEVKVKKPQGEENAYILNSNGDFWYAWEVRFVLSDILVPLEENETGPSTMPYDVGDIVYIDISPFKKPIYGVIIEKDGSSVRYLYTYGLDFVGLQWVNTLAHYRLKKVDAKDLTDDEAPLVFLSSVIGADERTAWDLINVLVTQNGASFEMLVKMFGEKETIAVKDWKQRVKWLKPNNSDFLKFIASKDIREHLMRIKYELSDVECMFVTDYSYRPLNEKHEGYREIMKNTSDENLRELLKKRIELEKILLNVFEQKDDAVYTYSFIDYNERYEDDNVYANWRDCFNEAIKMDQYARLIKIEKLWINDNSSGRRSISVIFSNKMEVINVGDRGILDEELKDKYVYAYKWYKDIRLPLPFKRGDILQSITGGTFVYEPDWKKTPVGGYCVDDDGSVGLYTQVEWLGVEYLKRGLEKNAKILNDISRYLKGEIELVDFIKKCRG